jgi:mannose-6-phosphate isomerase-like protein (cupin superfamily)
MINLDKINVPPTIVGSSGTAIRRLGDTHPHHGDHMTAIKPLLAPEEILRALKESIRPGVPSFFQLRTQLPAAGRSDLPIAATERMTVILKSYAEGGENEIHAHPHEDHVFVVLQGQASFQGPRGELKVAVAYDGVVLPAGTFYRFISSGDVPLVMLRVGCAEAGADILARIAFYCNALDANSNVIRQVTPVLSDNWFPAATA